MRRKRYTDDELIWAKYSEVPVEMRLCASVEDMSEEARAIWLAIARRYLACGWEPRCAR